jgi:outer membrane protein assembly factor BamB
LQHLRLRARGIAATVAGLIIGLLSACAAAPEQIVVSQPPVTQAPASDPPLTEWSAATPPEAPALAASTSLAAAVAAPAVVGRPQYQMDAQHSGRSPYSGPAQPVLLRSFDSSALSTKAPATPKADIQSSAAIGPDGTIYLGDLPGNLMAFRDPGRGKELEMIWRFHPDGESSFHSTPAIAADGTIYLGFSTGGPPADAHGTFYALNPQGQVLWKVDLGGGRQSSSPTLGPDGTVYVTSGAGKLFAISPEGQTLWTAQTGLVLKASPALGQDGTVYVASMNDQLYAIAPPPAGQTQGSVQWTFRFGDFPGEGTPVVAAAPPSGSDGKGSGATPTIGPDGTIYIGADNSNMYAIAPNGQLKWQFGAEREVAGIWSSAALSADGEMLYFGANRGGVYALRTGDGGLVWQYSIAGSIYSSLTLDRDGVLYTGSTAGHLIAINSRTGTQAWDYTNPADVAVWTAPALDSDGNLLIGDREGLVSLIGNG